MPDTIWSLLLAGFTWFIRSAILPLFGDASSQIASLNMAKILAQNGFVVFELIYDTLGSVVNLTLFGIFMGILFVFFFIRLILAIWLFILKLIPVVGH